MIIMENNENSDGILSNQAIYEIMSCTDRKLRSNFDFTNKITIKHLDGSEFFLPNARLKEDNKRIFVYTEHCGFFWFFKKDLKETRHTIYEYDEEKKESNITHDKIIVLDTEF